MRYLFIVSPALCRKTFNTFDSVVVSIVPVVHTNAEETAQDWRNLHQEKKVKDHSTGNFSIELASQLGLAGRINTVYTYDLSKDFIFEKFASALSRYLPVLCLLLLSSAPRIRTTTSLAA